MLRIDSRRGAAAGNDVRGFIHRHDAFHLNALERFEIRCDAGNHHTI